VREGISYLRGDRVLQSTFYIDLDAMIFGMRGRCSRDRDRPVPRRAGILGSWRGPGSAR